MGIFDLKENVCFKLSLKKQNYQWITEGFPLARIIFKTFGDLFLFLVVVDPSMMGSVGDGRLSVMPFPMAFLQVDFHQLITNEFFPR